jgi:hypothetical protein
LALRRGKLDAKELVVSLSVPDDVKIALLYNILNKYHIEDPHEFTSLISDKYENFLSSGSEVFFDKMKMKLISLDRRKYVGEAIAECLKLIIYVYSNMLTKTFLYMYYLF